MSALRFFAVALIFGAVSIAWMLLGGTIDYRTHELNRSLSEKVNTLWGPADLRQVAPFVAAGRDAPIAASRSDIAVAFAHENRSKGLLWFSTYTVDFRAEYAFAVPAGAAEGAAIRFVLPSCGGSFEGLTLTLDGKPAAPAPYGSETNVLQFAVSPGEHTLAVAYRTRGRDSWVYQTSPGDQTVLLKDFTLTATTDFAAIDYPNSCLSPVDPAQPIQGGMQAVWRYDNLQTRQAVGIQMPSRQNPGPMAARMSYFAPVSLMFFFTVLFTVVVLKKVPLHPMHYLFIAAGFFAFHILLSYLVDVISIHAAFWVCAAVSVVLVVSYMRLVAGVKFALAYVGLAQLVFLVGFSYAFFWKGRTGLTVTVGAIATLFVLMQATGRVNWNEVFRRPAPPLPPSPPGLPGSPPQAVPIDLQT